MKKSSLKVWHDGCLSRGLGVARNVMSSVFEFKVPVRKKAPRRHKSAPFPKEGDLLAFSPYWVLEFKNQLHYTSNHTKTSE